MKVTVTGATGFIGRQVIQELSIRGGCSVTASAKRTEVPLNLPEGVGYIPLDIAATSPGVFDRLNRPDVLIHLAWAGLPNYHSLHHFESELPVQYQFLRQLIKEGQPRLLVSGTCYEYGMASGELTEDTPPCPANPYAYAKDALRCQLQFLRTEKSFDLTWARLFYMFGDGQADTSLYGQLRKAVTDRQPSFAMSRGEQLRDFMPVQVVAKRLVDMALAQSLSGIFNVCSGRPTSVRSLVEGWVKDWGATIRLDLGRYPYPTHEPLAFWGSARRLDAALNNNGIAG